MPRVKHLLILVPTGVFPALSSIVIHIEALFSFYVRGYNFLYRLYDFIARNILFRRASVFGVRFKSLLVRIQNKFALGVFFKYFNFNIRINYKFYHFLIWLCLWNAFLLLFILFIHFFLFRILFCRIFSGFVEFRFFSFCPLLLF